MNKFNSLLHGTPKAWDECRKPHKGGGGGGGGTSTTTQEIPAELKPLASAYTTKAINLSDQPYNPFQSQRYTDLNPTQTQGIGMVQNRALNGSQTNANAETALNQFVQGGATNPYLDATYDRAAGKVSGSVNSQFNKPGAFGGTAHQQVLGDTLGGMATDLYGGAYAQDRANQMQAIGMAPQFGNLAYQDASQLLNVGQIEQDQAQKGLDFGYQQFQEQENDPYKKLAAMAAVFGSNLGGSSTTTSNQQSSGGGK
mgnify:FL=1